MTSVKLYFFCFDVVVSGLDVLDVEIRQKGKFQTPYSLSRTITVNFNPYLHKFGGHFSYLLFFPTFVCAKEYSNLGLSAKMFVCDEAKNLWFFVPTFLRMINSFSVELFSTYYFVLTASDCYLRGYCL